jgi:hypothetical protein
VRKFLKITRAAAKLRQIIERKKVAEMFMGMRRNAKAIIV